MTPEEVVRLVVDEQRAAAAARDPRSLAQLGLDSLAALEVLAGLVHACPGMQLGDELATVELTVARLRALVGAHRNLGPAEMTLVVELPSSPTDRGGAP